MPRLRMGVRLLLIGMFLLPYLLHSGQSAQIADVATLTHGIASGDVTSHSVVIWSRANHEVYLHVAYDRNPDFSHPKTAQPLFVTHSLCLERVRSRTEESNISFWNKRF